MTRTRGHAMDVKQDGVSQKEGPFSLQIILDFDSILLYYLCLFMLVYFSTVAEREDAVNRYRLVYLSLMVYQDCILFFVYVDTQNVAPFEL